MPTDDTPEFDAVSKIISVLNPMDDEARAHVIQTVCTWYKIPIGQAARPMPRKQYPGAATESEGEPPSQFSDRRVMTPKEFLLEKAPKTDVDRVACLAYYLTNYREVTDFKTADISKLNTEAAQRAFANTAQACKNALSNHYLAPSSKRGFRQLSAMGEQYVNELPDVEAARAVRRKLSPKKVRRNKKSK